MKPGERNSESPPWLPVGQALTSYSTAFLCTIAVQLEWSHWCSDQYSQMGCWCHKWQFNPVCYSLKAIHAPLDSCVFVICCLIAYDFVSIYMSLQTNLVGVFYEWYYFENWKSLGEFTSNLINGLQSGRFKILLNSR